MLRPCTKIASLLLIVFLVFQTFAAEVPLVSTPWPEHEPSLIKLSNGTRAVAYSRDVKTSPASKEIFLMFDRGSGWGTPFIISEGGLGASRHDRFPALLELPNNRLLIVWSQCAITSPDCNIVYNIYDVGAADWVPEAFTVLVDDAYLNVHPSTVLKPTGSICVFWQSDKNGNNDIFYSCFPEDWVTPPTVFLMPQSASPANDYWPSATLKDGLVWLAWDRENQDIYLTVNSTSWATPVQLTTNAALDKRPSLATTGDGGLWVFWETSRDCCGSYDEFNIYYKKSYDPMNLNSWLPDTRLTSAVYNDLEPSAFETQTGEIGIVFSSNREGSQGYDLYYATIVRKTGDTDWDGDVDLDDLIGTFLAQFTTTPTNLYRYDINRDGKIDLDDLIAVYLKQFT